MSEQINIQTLSDQDIFTIAGKIQSQIFMLNSQLNVLFMELHQRANKPAPAPAAINLPKLKKVTELPKPPVEKE